MGSYSKAEHEVLKSQVAIDGPVASGKTAVGRAVTVSYTHLRAHET